MVKEWARFTYRIYDCTFHPTLFKAIVMSQTQEKWESFRRSRRDMFRRIQKEDPGFWTEVRDLWETHLQETITTAGAVVRKFPPHSRGIHSNPGRGGNTPVDPGDGGPNSRTGRQRGYGRDGYPDHRGLGLPRPAAVGLRETGGTRHGGSGWREGGYRGQGQGLGGDQGVRFRFPADPKVGGRLEEIRASPAAEGLLELLEQEPPIYGVSPPPRTGLLFPVRGVGDYDQGVLPMWPGVA